MFLIFQMLLFVRSLSCFYQFFASSVFLALRLSQYTSASLHRFANLHFVVCLSPRCFSLVADDPTSFFVPTCNPLLLALFQFSVFQQHTSASFHRFANFRVVVCLSTRCFCLAADDPRFCCCPLQLVALSLVSPPVSTHMQAFTALPIFVLSFACLPDASAQQPVIPTSLFLPSIALCSLPSFIHFACALVHSLRRPIYPVLPGLSSASQLRSQSVCS